MGEKAGGNLTKENASVGRYEIIWPERAGTEWIAALHIQNVHFLVTQWHIFRHQSAIVLHEVVDTFHQNPVKAGIVNNVADYAYSSWAEYSGEVYSQARICHVEAVLRRIPFEVLQELVCTPLPESLHVMDIEDEVTRHRLSDEQVKELIKIYSHCANATEFQRLERSLQAEFIHIFRKQGASWRQLEDCV